jgi:CheY-like chemotaxis protein
MHKAKVLLVENSSIVLQIEKRYLKNEAVAVTTAVDADGALTAARTIHPDLVYLAYSLPGMDGAAVCRALKADPELAGTPVVMVSNATEGEIALCRAAGCDALITKPVDRREFLEAGRSLLSRTRRRDVRIPCRAIAAYIQDGTTWYGTIEDISMSGMFVGTQREVVPGETLAMKFVLPWSGSAVVEATARVAWLNGDRQSRNQRLTQGFGVIFQDLGKDAEEQIKSYLESIRMRLGR